MGEVYRARDTRLDRYVALKLLNPRISHDPLLRARFEREARAIASLAHPNICVLYDLGVEEIASPDSAEGERVPYLVMEFLEGATLQQKLHDGSPSLQAMIGIAIELADALECAHEKGIIHRDVKPSNIWITRRGMAKLLDFGLALLESDGNEDDATALRTTPGTTIGTIRYMSPEQAAGDRLTTSTDIFSLGIVLHEALTGRHPFGDGASNVAIARAIVASPAQPMSVVRGDLPTDLDPLVLRMLEKDPANRPSAGEVRSALESLLSEHAPGAVLAAVRSSSFSVDAEPTLMVRRQEGAASRVVGRSKEREILLDAFDDVAEGTSRVLGLAGEPGIGKSTLVEDLLEQLSTRPCRIAVGRCSERLAGSDAYLPWLEAMEFLTRHDGAATAKVRELAPSWFRQLSPSLSGSHSGESETPGAPPSQERLKREILSLLEQLGTTSPLVIVLEDVHWADVSTVDLVGYLGAHLGGVRLLLLLTYRPSDLQLRSHPFVQVRKELLSKKSVREIEVGFLESDDIATYLEREFPGNRFTSEFAVLIERRTEGNPLFMTDLISTLRDSGVIARATDGAWIITSDIASIEESLPQSIVMAIERKLDRIEQEHRPLISAAAVQGVDFDSAVVAAALELDEANVEETLGDLEKKHALIRRLGEDEYPDQTPTVRYRFVHALYQSAIFSTLGPARRRAMSRSIAGAISRFAAGRTGEYASELAFLFEGARDFQRAAESFSKAAANARRLFANREAEAFVRRGLDACLRLPEGESRNRMQSELEETLGELAHLAARHSEAAEHYAAAIEHAPEPDRVRLARLYRRTGNVQQSMRHFDAARDAHRLAEETLQKTPSDTTRWRREWIQLQLNRIWLEYWTADVEAMTAYLDNAQSAVEEHGSDSQLAAFYHSRALMALRRDRYRPDQQTLEDQWKGLKAAERLGDVGVLAMMYFLTGFIHLWRGELTEARELLARSREAAEKAGDLVIVVRAVSYRCVTERRLGELETTESFAMEARDLADQLKMREYTILADANFAWLAWRRGEDDAVLELGLRAVDEGVPLGPAMPFLWTAAFPLIDVLLRKGRLEEASEVGETLLKPVQHRLPDSLDDALRRAGESIRSGDLEAARARLTDAIALAREHRYL